MYHEVASRIRVATLVVLVGFMVTTAAGCNGDDDAIIDDDGAVRFVHAVPDAPPVDIYVAGDDSVLIADVSYGQASGFQFLQTGLYEFEVREAGAGPGGDVIASTDAIDVFDGDRISAVIAGDETGFQPVVVRHDFNREDEAFVHLVHASPDAPAIGLDIGDDGTLQIENVEPFSAVPEGAVQVPDEEFQLAVFAEGERFTSFTLPDLDDGDEFLAVAIGRTADLPREPTGLNLIIVGEGSDVRIISQDPSLFFVHAVADAPAVDVELEDDDRTWEATDLEFGVLSEPLQVRPGDGYDADVQLAGTDQLVFEQNLGDLDAGQRYLMVIGGNAGTDDLELFTLGQQFDLEVEEPQVRLVHASADAPSVDVGAVEDGSLSIPAIAEDLDFGEDSPEDGAFIPAGEQTFGLAPAGEIVPIATFDVDVPDGAQLFAVVAGAAEPVEGEQPLQLFVIDSSIFPWELAIVEAGAVD